MNIKQFKQSFSGFISKFENDTCKHAIWGGVITGGFEYWLMRNFPKVHDKYVDVIKSLKIPDFNIKRIYELYYQTKPAYNGLELAEEFECGYQTIYNRMEENGISRRNPSEAQIVRCKKKKGNNDLNKGDNK